MNRSLIALVAVATLLTLASPVMAALSPTACAILQQAAQVSPNLQGALNNSGCPSVSSSSPNPTVAASEPLALLTVGLGLLGAGLLRRR